MTAPEIQALSKWFYANCYGLDCCPAHDPRIMAKELVRVLKQANSRLNEAELRERLMP